MNDFLAHIKSIHKELGITENYEHRYRLKLQYEETDLVDVGKDMYGRPQKIAKVAVKPWLQMKEQAKREGIELNLVSAFRSVEKQAEIIRRKTASGQKIDEILNVSAAPGYSEHHSGRALDLATPDCEPLTEAFEETAAFFWLQKHASTFSFALAYPRDNECGIAYEPWHWTFQLP